jgi:hypothetical protein
MKEKFIIFITLIVLIAVLIGVNAASYAKKEKVPDTEFQPNRSTYNTGATGTRALYELLSETGRRVTRWQEPSSALSLENKNRPDTLVIVGSLRRELETTEIDHLLAWVRTGGKLVVIDRQPDKRLLAAADDWQISANYSRAKPGFETDPSDQKQMTDGANAARPVQPTVFTTSVNAVQPSRFAASITLERRGEDDSPAENAGEGEGVGAGGPVYQKEPVAKDEEDDYDAHEPPARPTPKPINLPKDKILKTGKIGAPPAAPLVHLANDKKNILIDFAYGAGRIVYLADPYIVTNSGITLVDNAQLALNIVSSGEGLIAFDEYHQGFGVNNNQLLTYFTGTPIVPIVLQLALLAGLIFYSQSRRFARALPVDEPNRLSKLEYVAAMAELQQRTKAFDLAIENIYTDFRRRVSRAFGVDNFTTARTDLAKMIAERVPSEDARQIDELLGKCEDVSHGERTNKKEVLELAGRLRGLEEKLGLQRRKKRKQSEK